MGYAASNYSIQQIKFEFLSYIKEFGGRGDDWFIGTAKTLPERLPADPLGETIWICKPALSERAATIVLDHMTSRHGVRGVPDDAVGRGSWVYMYRHADRPH